EYDVLGARAQPAQRDDHRFLAARGHHDRLGGNADALVDLQHPREHGPELTIRLAVLHDGLPDARLARALSPQVPDVGSQVTLDIGDGIELIEWPARGERYRGGETAGHLIKEVHRRLHGIGDPRLERLNHQI